MKISIDFDGTLWSYMGFFRAYMSMMQGLGHAVGMLTGHAAETESADIALMLARGFPRPDFYFGRTPDYLHVNGAHFKSMIIAREKIDTHFDDYDYDNSETIDLFARLGQEPHIVRVCARRPLDDAAGRKIHYE